MPINLTVGSDPPISVSTLQDLASAVESNFTTGAEFIGQLDRPISTLPSNLSSTIQYTSGNQSWKLGDFGFTLSGGVTGKISVLTSGNILSYTDGFATEMSIGLTTTTNANPTKSIPVPADTAYICVELDFQISGGITGSYTSGIYGISGSANTNDTFSFAFYKKCCPTVLLRDAISEAFSDFVLPLHDSTLNNLKSGDYLHYNFNGNLQLGLGASIGLDKVFYAGQYKADIPGTANAVAVSASVQAKVQAGAELAFNFSYAGTFEALLWKDDPTTGHLHLYRSKTQDASLGLNVGVTLTSDPTASANVMTDQLGNLLVGSLPGPLGTALKTAVLPDASSEISKYVGEANSKVAGWLKPFSQAKATLDFAVDKTNQTFLLMDYTFNLNAPAFQTAWDAAYQGKFLDALRDPNGGVSLAVGSGLEKFYDDKTSITLNLFGQLTAAWTDAVISNSSLFYAGNNIFHLVSNVGRQLMSLINQSKREIDIYFAAQADLSATGLALGPIDLHCILQATNNQKYGGYIATVFGLLTTGTDNTILTKSIAALASQKNTTQVLHIIFTPRAYGQLEFSVVTNTPYNETADMSNYASFENACATRDLEITSPANFNYGNQNLDYSVWRNWNIACTDQWPAPPSALPNRTQTGNPSAGISTYLNQTFPDAGEVAQLIGYVLQARSDFMNLCQDLKTLATLAVADPNLETWDNLVAHLKSIIQNDVPQDFVAPSALALCRLCAGGPPVPVVGPAPGLTDQNSIAITITYS